MYADIRQATMKMLWIKLHGKKLRKLKTRPRSISGYRKQRIATALQGLHVLKTCNQRIQVKKLEFSKIWKFRKFVHKTFWSFVETLPWGLFRIQWNIYNGALRENSWRVKAANFFHEKLHRRYYHIFFTRNLFCQLIKFSFVTIWDSRHFA